MTSSPRLSLDYLTPQQAQKHVTVNESLRRLDALVSLTVISRSISAEPASPAEGDAYLMIAAATGAAWAAYAPDAIAVFQDGAWTEIAAVEGLRAYIVDETGLFAFSGGAWSSVGGGGLANPAQLGVNATPDATNRLAVKSDAVLHSHDDVTPGSGDARHIINKTAAGNTASVIFQNGYSGRAEFGITGDDDFHMKVSPDGATFYEGIKIAATNGAVSFPAGLAAPLGVGDGGTGAATALTALNTLGLRYPLGNINNDEFAFAYFGSAIYGSAILAVSNAVSTGATAFFHARMAPSPSMTTLFSAGPAFTNNTGVLTGTTGADGKINFSVTSDGKFYVENRSGSAVNYTLFAFQR